MVQLFIRHTMKNFKPAPGIAVIEGVEEQIEGLVLTQKSQGRIIKGKIIFMGDYDTTSTGEKILPERYGKVGDFVWFMHYYDEGGVDIMTIKGKKYFAVKWADIRGREI